MINLSYGTIAGPHDGTAPLEIAIEEHIARAAAQGVTLRVVLPAGNSYLSRCHAETRLRGSGSRATLRWRVQPDDQTPSFVEIWMPPRPAGAARQRLELTVTAPNGRSRILPRHPRPVSRMDHAARQLRAPELYRQGPAPARAACSWWRCGPRSTTIPTEATAPSGVWTLTFKNTTLKPAQRVHAWIQRDDLALRPPCSRPPILFR